MAKDTTSSETTGPELTTRSIIVGLVVALIIGSAYPYCVLKLGFGPNLSVVSAFFGFIALVLILRAAGTNARENNIVQTMGTIDRRARRIDCDRDCLSRTPRQVRHWSNGFVFADQR